MTRFAPRPEGPPHRRTGYGLMLRGRMHWRGRAAALVEVRDPA